MALDRRTRAERDRTEHEPLLAVEKRLVGWSVIAGVVLLGLLMWLSYTFFPAR